MKAKNTELLRLARLVQKDIASGRISDNARLAVAALADYQNPVIELLELALTQKSRSLVDALAYLFSNALEALRFDIEAGYKTASELAEGVRRRLYAAARAAEIDPEVIFFLIQCLGEAKIDLDKDLRAMVEQLIEKIGQEHTAELDLADPAASLGFICDLVKQADGDEFALFSVLGESVDGFPDEIGRAHV